MGPLRTEAGLEDTESGTGARRGARVRRGRSFTSGEEGVCVLNQSLHHAHHLDGRHRGCIQLRLVPGTEGSGRESPPSNVLVAPSLPGPVLAAGNTRTNQSHQVPVLRSSQTPWMANTPLTHRTFPLRTWQALPVGHGAFPPRSVPRQPLPGNCTQRMNGILLPSMAREQQ